MQNIEGSIEESEMIVIGTAIRENSQIAPLYEMVKPGQMKSQAGKAVYREVKEMIDEGLSADMVSVSQRLFDKDFDVPGDYIIECVEHAKIAQRPKQHAKKIARHDAMGRIEEAGHRLTRADADPMELTQQAREYFDEITESIEDSESECVDLSDQLVQSIEQAKSGEQSEGFKFGLRDVDDMVGAVEPGEVAIIAGRPAMGKTSCLRQVALRTSKDHPVAFFSAEMTPSQLSEAFLISESGIRFSEIRDGRISDERMNEVRKAARKLEDRELIIDECSSTHISHIENRIRVLKKTRDIEAVFVDYIQLFTCKDSDSRQDEVRKISHRFQQIAKQLDIAVFEAAQLNRRVEQREEKRPRLSDLRASGGIEQDAHYVFLLYRPHYYGLSEEEGEAQIIVAKQRMGQTGTCDVSWIPERMRFEDFHPEPQSFGG